MTISENNEKKEKTAYNKNSPFLTIIKERYPLTKSGSTKKTYHISLSLEGGDAIHFKPGDSVGILPQNDPLLVQELLHVMKATGEESIVDPRSGVSMNFQEFLSMKVNFSRIPSSLLQLLYDLDPPHDQKNQLHRVLQKENKELFNQFIHQKDLLDLFMEISIPQLPLQEICNQFAPLLPRFYSIASSLKSFPNEVHLTVALFSFLHKERPRYGVASHYLCNTAEAKKTLVPIYIQSSHSFFLPEDPSAPIIMIGPGTGVAPFRAFLQERISLQSQGKNWLFFGERNRESDFLYQDFWEDLEKKGHVKLSLAFSRDQEEKIYVQHRMLEHAKILWEWLEQGAYLYVCGDAHKMAKDVESALFLILKKQGNLSEERAKEYFKSLKQQKRYRTDVY